MKTKTPVLVLTGASGFIGRELLENLKSDFRIFAIARRSQHESHAPVHPNIAWIRADISDQHSLAKAFREITTAGGAEYLIHLAAFYEFAGEEFEEYRLTNVIGTENVINHARQLNLKLFVFASSVAACSFPPKNGTVDESSPPDGEHIYAWTKNRGEKIVTEAARHIPAVIVRFGAVYSDWCEYPPLFMFLNTWLGKSWRSRILAGKGISAIPYIHIRDVMVFFRRLLTTYQNIKPAEILIASTEGSTTHFDLFALATRYFFGKEHKPIMVPRIFAALGLYLIFFLGKLVKRLPFERPWMHKYIDLKLNVGNEKTRSLLQWNPNPRYFILNRLPFLLERLKSEPYAWHMRNMVAMRRVAARPDFKIYSILAEAENEIIDTLSNSPAKDKIILLKEKSTDDLVWFNRLIFRLILTSIHTANRLLLQNYFEISASSRFAAGYNVREIKLLLETFNKIILEYLNEIDKLTPYRQLFYDYITMPIEFGIDEIEHQYSLSQMKKAGQDTGMIDRESTIESSARDLLEETIWSCLVHRK